MPRNVRNFWVEANIDGRETTLSGGPASKYGGFELTVFMRDNGEVKQALILTGHARADGRLFLTAETGEIGEESTEFGALGNGHVELSLRSER